MPEPVAVVVTESSQVGEARRAAVNLARLLGFEDSELSNVALVVTEAASRPQPIVPPALREAPARKRRIGPG